MTQDNLNIDDFDPSVELQNMKRFNSWVQTIVPFVYDNSLSYYEVLDKMAQYLNEMATRQNQLSGLYNALVEYVNTSKDEQVDFINAFVEKVTTEFNNFVTEMESKFDTFTEEMKAEYEAFKTEINTTITEFETKITEQQTAFETKITEQQNAFETKITEQQSAFETKITEQQTNFESTINTSFEELKTEMETFKTDLNTAQTEFETSINTAWEEYKTNLNSEWTETKEYIDNYFANLDTTEIMKTAITEMLEDGSLETYFDGIFPALIKLDSMISEPSEITYGYYWNSTDSKLYKYNETDSVWEEISLSDHCLYWYNDELYVLFRNNKLYYLNTIFDIDRTFTNYYSYYGQYKDDILYYEYSLADNTLSSTNKLYVGFQKSNEINSINGSIKVDGSSLTNEYKNFRPILSCDIQNYKIRIALQGFYYYYDDKLYINRNFNHIFTSYEEYNISVTDNDLIKKQNNVYTTLPENYEIKEPIVFIGNSSNVHLYCNYDKYSIGFDEYDSNTYKTGNVSEEGILTFYIINENDIQLCNANFSSKISISDENHYLTQYEKLYFYSIGNTIITKNSGLFLITGDHNTYYKLTNYDSTTSPATAEIELYTEKTFGKMYQFYTKKYTYLDSNYNTYRDIIMYYNNGVHFYDGTNDLLIYNSNDYNIYNSNIIQINEYEGVVPILYNYNLSYYLRSLAYPTLSEINGYIINNYVTTEALTTELGNYVTTDSLASLDYATTDYVDEKVANITTSEDLNIIRVLSLDGEPNSSVSGENSYYWSSTDGKLYKYNTETSAYEDITDTLNLSNVILLYRTSEGMDSYWIDTANGNLIYRVTNNLGEYDDILTSISNLETSLSTTNESVATNTSDISTIESNLESNYLLAQYKDGVKGYYKTYTTYFLGYYETISANNSKVFESYIDLSGYQKGQIIDVSFSDGKFTTAPTNISSKGVLTYQSPLNSDTMYDRQGSIASYSSEVKYSDSSISITPYIHLSGQVSNLNNDSDVYYICYIKLVIETLQYNSGE